MTSLVALVSGFGWHVADLQRAAAGQRITLHAIPFSQISAFVGIGEAPRADRARKPQSRIGGGGFDLLASDGVLVRMMPPGSLEQVVFQNVETGNVHAFGQVNDDLLASSFQL